MIYIFEVSIWYDMTKYLCKIYKDAVKKFPRSPKINGKKTIKEFVKRYGTIEYIKVRFIYKYI